MIAQFILYERNKHYKKFEFSFFHITKSSIDFPRGKNTSRFIYMIFDLFSFSKRQIVCASHYAQFKWKICANFSGFIYTETRIFSQILCEINFYKRYSRHSVFKSAKSQKRRTFRQTALHKLSG